MRSAQEIINTLSLVPHPEGGYYREIYRSDLSVVSSNVNNNRNAVTCIYFLLTKGQISRFHKVKHDEVWNFYLGDPLRLIDMNKQEANEIILGDYENTLCSQHVIKAEQWQAAETTGEYSLVGCTVAPGFDFTDFAFLSTHKDCQRLVQQYPDLTAFI